jgi:uncharacterized protein YjbJ (UPF0337 family)
MNTLTIRGHWNVIRGKLKQKWSTLTDDDLRYIEGQEEEMLGRIQKRVGATLEEVQRALEELAVEEDYKSRD